MPPPVPCTGIDNNAQANQSPHPSTPPSSSPSKTDRIDYTLLASSWRLLGGVSSTAVTLVAKGNEAAMHRLTQC
ncbi:hypothetical protein N7478_010197 [Penicillium angulare]|uniref:uncharacterized protein n=1 Tax=Penicillium angulare TaxID=116970 RepID=UPI002540E402|nr:uncharacterized protein N7478_010197 [Penicillium angulare]KAJ5267389.1 hypothetical protein N7478_010197 [Penicillium angulare]